MVPLSITLRNFLSYGDSEVTLDFSGMHVVCLSGENGHGKSALLDAITWVLWGETRLGKQGHEQLIRIGADEMSVVLTFRVGNDVFRVKRQRSRRSSGANWEIQKSDPVLTWRPLTGVNVSDTGRTIQQIVRMSYDTFLNSAYLKQGRADEFVRQTSNRRKEILSDVLELSRYDKLEERAKQRAKSFAEDAFDMERQASQAKAIAADADRFRGELLDAENQLTARTVELDAAASARISTEKNYTDLKHQGEQQRALMSQLEAIRTEIQSTEREHKLAHDNIDALNRLIENRDVIEKDHQALCDARARVMEIARLLAELQSVQVAILNTEHSINREKDSLQNAATQLSKEIATAESSQALAENLTKKLSDKKKSAAVFQDVEKQQQKIKRELENINSKIYELRAEYDHLDKQIAAEQARHERLLNQSETCSICGSPLPPSRIEELASESELQIAELKRKLASVREGGTSAKREHNTLQQELAHLDRQAEEFRAQHIEMTKLEQQLSTAKAGYERLDVARKHFQEITDQLQNGNFAAEFRQTLSGLKERAKELSPLQKENNDLSDQIVKLSPVENVYRELLNAESRLVAEQRILTLSQRNLDKLKTQMETITEQVDGLLGIDERIREAEKELQLTTVQERSAKQLVSESQNQIGRLQRSLEQCADAAEKQKTFEKSLEVMKQEEALYKVLTAAFGKRGIQANIIESALPELEQYTNDILDRLTDGDLRVFIETTRQAKTKNASPIETLDIKISDSLGTRPLEMYSGGEAFRVSFALRIALSMLLVRRSGAELQTLIIDEGFGTQDAKGREKLVDAINAIKQDFDRILVITHIEELKEAFATRIEVYKTSEGSRLSVVHADAIG